MHIPGLRTCPPPEPPLHAAVVARLNHGLGIVRNQPRYGEFPEPVVAYFNRRTAAGMALHEPWAIALNRGLLEVHPRENLEETVLHELAHLVVGYARRQRIIRGRSTAHGEDWQNVMRQWFHVEPRRTHDLSVSHLDIRRQRRWAYGCGCRTWQVTTVRHNRIQRGLAEYRCERCRGTLTFLAARS
jgi:SprT protein